MVLAQKRPKIGDKSMGKLRDLAYKYIFSMITIKTP
jgi:hypothetical protein